VRKIASREGRKRSTKNLDKEREGEEEGIADVRNHISPMEGKRPYLEKSLGKKKKDGKRSEKEGILIVRKRDVRKRNSTLRLETRGERGRTCQAEKVLKT